VSTARTSASLPPSLAGLLPSLPVLTLVLSRRGDALPRLSAKRAARAAAYNSDDDEDEDDDDEPLPAGLDMRRPEPESIEGQVDATREELEMGDSEDEDDEDDDEALQTGNLEDLRQVEKRMRTAARVLSHWKELGPATGRCVPPLHHFSLSSASLTHSPVPPQVPLRPRRAAHRRHLPVPRLHAVPRRKAVRDLWRRGGASLSLFVSSLLVALLTL